MLDFELLAMGLLFGADGKTRLFTTLALLAAALLVAALIIRRAERWRKKAAAQVSVGDQLTHFRELYEQGELTEEEFHRIRRQLGGQLREQLQVQSTAKSAEGDASPQADKDGPSDWSVEVDAPDDK